MLTTKEIKKIEDFVYAKPRSLQEVALHIGRSWRTADRYVDELAKEYGTIATRTFREGTRGALKIVFWASMENAHQSVFQERLENDIMHYKRKEDFSAFDIYQHVAEKDRKAVVITTGKEDRIDIEEWTKELLEAKKQVLIFSGNLSFLNLSCKGCDPLETFSTLVKKGVSVKILSRVDLAAMDNVQKILSLNFRHGKELVEIHHAEHPIRAFIFDNRLLRIREIKEPTGKANELNRRVFIYYLIKDKDWIEWMTRIFWKMFSNSIDAKRRIEQLKTLSF
jgi:predicted DNA binding protein